MYTHSVYVHTYTLYVHTYTLYTFTLHVRHSCKPIRNPTQVCAGTTWAFPSPHLCLGPPAVLIFHVEPVIMRGRGLWTSTVWKRMLAVWSLQGCLFVAISYLLYVKGWTDDWSFLDFLCLYFFYSFYCSYVIYNKIFILFFHLFI